MDTLPTEENKDETPVADTATEAPAVADEATATEAPAADETAATPAEGGEASA